MQSGINFIKVEAIRDSKLAPENVTSYITKETHEFLKRSQLATGDVLFSIAGSIGTCAIVTEAVLPANTNQALAIIRGAAAAFSIAFLQYSTRSSLLESALAKARGGAMNNISLQDVNNLLLSLPPMAEQRRIVAKVDELMVLCDRLEAAQAEQESRRDKLAAASLHRLNNGANPDEFREHAHFHLRHLPRITIRPEHIQRLRETILDLAVHGKLVPQDPKDEPSSELLKRIQKEKAQSNKEGTNKKVPISFDEEDPPFSLPVSWSWARFTEVASIDSNLVKPERFPDHPHIAPDNIESRSGRLLQYQNIRDSNVFSAKHRFFPGHIVYSKIRPNLAKAALVDFEGLCSADMYPIRSFLDRAFLLKFMLSEAFVQQSIKEDNRVAMPKINQESLSKIFVVVPPLAEQRRIVAKVGELMTLCDRLEAQLTATQTESRRLLEAVLHEALNLHTGNDRNAHL